MMKNPRLSTIIVGVALLNLFFLRVFLPSDAGQSKKDTASKPFGISKRIPWMTANVKGSPEPPPLYKTERAFPKLTFKNPLLLTTAPGINRFFVCEQAGKIFSFPIDPNVAAADLVIDLSKE